MSKTHKVSFVKKTDGRAARGAQTKQKIIDALFELIESGQSAPTGEQVAEKAQVGLRSVYRHFDDIDTLYAAIQDRLDASLRPLIESAQEKIKGNLEERTRAMMDIRGEFYERAGPFIRSDRSRHWNTPEIERRRASGSMEMRLWLWTCLPECASASPAARAGVEMAASFAAWDQLRNEQKLSIEDAKACTVEAILKLLEPA